jgi:hypothetical protein
VGEGNIEVKVQEAGTVLLILGTMLGGGTFCSDTRRTPFPLLVAAGLQWKGKKGQTDCDEGGLVTDPDLRLSSGCCVGPELIEGESWCLWINEAI